MLYIKMSGPVGWSDPLEKDSRKIGEYHFTNNWCNEGIKEDFTKLLLEPLILSGTVFTSPFNVLEIGCYEGQSTAWFIDNLLHHPESKIICVDPFATSDTTSPVNDNTFELFQKNMACTRFPEKLIIYKMFSRDALPQLTCFPPIFGHTSRIQGMFDMIYIDGSHICSDVLYDATISWNLLKKGGLMWFDDYGSTSDEGRGVSKAIDAFLSCRRNDEWIDVLNGYQRVIRKM